MPQAREKMSLLLHARSGPSLALVSPFVFSVLITSWAATGKVEGRLSQSPLW